MLQRDGPKIKEELNEKEVIWTLVEFDKRRERDIKKNGMIKGLAKSVEEILEILYTNGD